MLLIEAAFFDSACPAISFALFVRRRGKFVFQLAAKTGFLAAMRIVRSRREIRVVTARSLRLVGGEIIVEIVRAGVQVLDAFTLGAAEGGEVLVVVVGVMPDGAWGLGERVDEELVVRFMVVVADPAVGEIARLVFH